jgi:putative aminopeptidase FrvX
MHSPVEMVDLGDLEAVVELIAGFAESLTGELDLSR